MARVLQDYWPVLLHTYWPVILQDYWLVRHAFLMLANGLFLLVAETVPPIRCRRCERAILYESSPAMTGPLSLERIFLVVLVLWLMVRRTAPRIAIYGTDFVAMTGAMGMAEVLTAPRSPWQNPFVERLVGSIRRECLDHVIVWNERSLRRTLQNYFAYYQRSRTHLSLGKEAPEPRAVEPPEQGCVVAIPQVGGLHHRYQRRAA
jgi:hypothetical protein